MNALGASILSLLVTTVLFAPKRWALMAMAAGILYLTHAQQVNLAGFNLYALRFLELAGFARIMVRRELSLREINRVDRVFLMVYAYTLTVFLLRSDESKVFEIGAAVDAILSYFAFRALISDEADFKWFLRGFVVLLVPYTLSVIYETLTSQNPFAALGGIQLIGSGDDRWFRGGRLRATGSFGHPSLLGTLGGAFLPLYLGLWFAKGNRAIASIGVATCLGIVWASNSGGSASCVAVGLIGWMLWSFRTRMQWVRRSVIAILVLTALFMEAPIWYILAKFSALTGGDGYHRSALLDVAFQNLDQWWLAGMPVLDTGKWLPYTNTNTGGVDMTNVFIMFGVTGGLGSVILLIALLTHGFKYVGRALNHIRISNNNSEAEYLFWGLAVMLAVHLINWLGIAYWDQTNVLWFMNLAALSALSHSVIQSRMKNAHSEVHVASPTLLERHKGLGVNAPHPQINNISARLIYKPMNAKSYRFRAEDE